MTDIIIRKEELADFLKEIGMEAEDHIADSGRNSIVISGYPFQGGSIFSIDYQEVIHKA